MKPTINLILLSLASFVCGLFFLWAFDRAREIDAIYEDSRVGIALLPCTVATVMGIVFTARTARIVLYQRSQKVRLHPAVGGLVTALNVPTFLCLALMIGYSPALILGPVLCPPLTLIGAIAALRSVRKDIPKGGCREGERGVDGEPAG